MQASKHADKRSTFLTNSPQSKTCKRCKDILRKVEAIGQDDGCHKGPGVHAVANPGAGNLDIARRVSASDGREAAVLIGLVKVHGQQRGHPGRGQEEDDVEDAVAVLGSRAFVVMRRVVTEIAVLVVGEGCARRETALFNGSAESLGSHLAAGRGLLCHEIMLILFWETDAVGVAQAETLSGCASRRVSDRQHGDNGAHDNRSRPGALGADERVALLVVGLHGHGRHCEIGAVDGNHGRLGQAGLGVVFLDGGIDGNDRDDEPKNEVDGDDSLVQVAIVASEEDVLDHCHGNGAEVHAQGRPDEHESPDLGVLVFDLSQTVLGPVVRQVDQEDETQHQEEHGATKRDVVAPKDKERIRDEERQDHKDEPSNNLGTPVSILNGSSGVPRGRNAKK